MKNDFNNISVNRVLIGCFYVISYSKIFNTVKITMSPVYANESSDPDLIWAYAIKIDNIGKSKCKILNNSWQVPNDFGEIEIFDVPSVEDFAIEPGETVQFIGGLPPSKAAGVIIGAYSLENENGEVFDIQIPVFSVGSSNQCNTVH